MQHPFKADRLAEALKNSWVRSSTAVTEHFTDHASKLDEIFERMRKDTALGFLDKEVYPEVEWWRLQDRQGFYLCNSMIQLMENVYLDLNLEDEHGHHDNAGWMALFELWARSETFQTTWFYCAKTYGRRFREFCERRFKPLSSERLPSATMMGHFTEHTSML